MVCCACRLEATCARTDDVMQQLMSEKRVLYRTNMDMDEAKLKRIETQADTAQELRTCARKVTSLEKRKAAMEAEVVRLQAALEERRVANRDRLAHLQWRKDQNVMQRDRLRKQLLQLSVLFPLAACNKRVVSWWYTSVHVCM